MLLPGEYTYFLRSHASWRLWKASLRVLIFSAVAIHSECYVYCHYKKTGSKWRPSQRAVRHFALLAGVHRWHVIYKIALMAFDCVSDQTATVYHCVETMLSSDLRDLSRSRRSAVDIVLDCVTARNQVRTKWGQLPPRWCKNCHRIELKKNHFITFL